MRTAINFFKKNLTNFGRFKHHARKQCQLKWLNMTFQKYQSIHELMECLFREKHTWKTFIINAINFLPSIFIFQILFLIYFSQIKFGGWENLWYFTRRSYFAGILQKKTKSAKIMKYNQGIIYYWWMFLRI